MVNKGRKVVYLNNLNWKQAQTDHIFDPQQKSLIRASGLKAFCPVEKRVENFMRKTNILQLGTLHSIYFYTRPKGLVKKTGKQNPRGRMFLFPHSHFDPVFRGKKTLFGPMARKYYSFSKKSVLKPLPVSNQFRGMDKL